MNEFNRNENEMNENKRDDTNLTNEPAGKEPEQEENNPAAANETAGISGMNDTTADLRENEPANESAPAQEGTYSFTRNDLTNPTYSAQPRPQNPQQQNPYGAYGSQESMNGQPNPQNAPYGAYRYAPGQGQPQNPNPNGAYGGYGSANPNSNPYNTGAYTNSYAPQNNPYYNGMQWKEPIDG